MLHSRCTNCCRHTSHRCRHLNRPNHEDYLHSWAMATVRGAMGKRGIWMEMAMATVRGVMAKWGMVMEMATLRQSMVMALAHIDTAYHLSTRRPDRSSTSPPSHNCPQPPPTPQYIAGRVCRRNRRTTCPGTNRSAQGTRWDRRVCTALYASPRQTRILAPMAMATAMATATALADTDTAYRWLLRQLGYRSMSPS